MKCGEIRNWSPYITKLWLRVLANKCICSSNVALSMRHSDTKEVYYTERMRRLTRTNSRRTYLRKTNLSYQMGKVKRQSLT